MAVYPLLSAKSPVAGSPERSLANREEREMTREVKVGLVVSCSFLCLVGVVVVTKLREKQLAADTSGAQASAQPDHPGGPPLRRSPPNSIPGEPGKAVEPQHTPSGNVTGVTPVSTAASGPNADAQTDPKAQPLQQVPAPASTIQSPAPQVNPVAASSPGLGGGILQTGGTDQGTDKGGQGKPPTNATEGGQQPLSASPGGTASGPAQPGPEDKNKSALALSPMGPAPGTALATPGVTNPMTAAVPNTGKPGEKPEPAIQQPPPVDQPRPINLNSPGQTPVPLPTQGLPPSGPTGPVTPETDKGVSDKSQLDTPGKPLLKPGPDTTETPGLAPVSTLPPPVAATPPAQPTEAVKPTETPKGEGINSGTGSTSTVPAAVPVAPTTPEPTPLAPPPAATPTTPLVPPTNSEPPPLASPAMVPPTESGTTGSTAPMQSLAPGSAEKKEEKPAAPTGTPLVPLPDVEKGNLTPIKPNDPGALPIPRAVPDLKPVVPVASPEVKPAVPVPPPDLKPVVPVPSPELRPFTPAAPPEVKAIPPAASPGLAVEQRTPTGSVFIAAPIPVGTANRTRVGDGTPAPVSSDNLTPLPPIVPPSTPAPGSGVLPTEKTGSTISTSPPPLPPVPPVVPSMSGNAPTELKAPLPIKAVPVPSTGTEPATLGGQPRVGLGVSQGTSAPALGATPASGGTSVLETTRTTHTTTPPSGNPGSGTSDSVPSMPGTLLPVTRTTTTDQSLPVKTGAPQVVPSGSSPPSSPAVLPTSPPSPPSGEVKRTYQPKSQVISWKETAHFVRPGETYADLCRTRYNNSEYARALQAWNRDPDQKTSPAVREGRLEPGDKIFLPSQEALEQLYPDLVPVRRLQGQSLTPVGGNERPNLVASSLADGMPPATLPRLYRVSGNGEPLFEIARKTLQDGTRWGEIAQLNPALSAERVVSAGTDVRLPAGANVPRENAP